MRAPILNKATEAKQNKEKKMSEKKQGNCASCKHSHHTTPNMCRVYKRISVKGGEGGETKGGPAYAEQDPINCGRYEKDVERIRKQEEARRDKLRKAKEREAILEGARP